MYELGLLHPVLLW